jgi:hypothetical protein
MIVVELNEFCADLFEFATQRLRLPAIARLLAMKRTQTITTEKRERHGLDPWVQWVSVHTGRTADKHGIEHLGDIPNLDTKQLWEVLSEKGISSGVWGAMNASRASASRCLFFLPDPWTFSETAYPRELNDFLALPRYYSKNYLHLRTKQIIKNGIRILKFLSKLEILRVIIGLLPTFVKTVLRHGIKNYVLFSLFDVINAKVFQVYHDKYKPDFSIIFLNSMAHAQHHLWTEKSGISKEMQYALVMIDRAMSTIFDNNPNEDLVILNALTQVQSFDDEDYLFRQRNPQAFLQMAGIKHARIEQLMTNDAHVFFDTQEDLEKAFNLLSDATIDGVKVFDVKKYKDQLKLFYQFDYWKAIESEAKLIINGKSLVFFDLFDCVVRRSGKHVPRGDIYSSKAIFSNKIPNHKIFNYILQEYGCQ